MTNSADTKIAYRKSEEMRHLLLAVAVSACGTDELYLRDQTPAADETETEVEVEREQPYNPLVDSTKPRPSPWCVPGVRRSIYGNEGPSIHRKREQICEEEEAQ